MSVAVHFLGLASTLRKLAAFGISGACGRTMRDSYREFYTQRDPEALSCRSRFMGLAVPIAPTWSLQLAYEQRARAATSFPQKQECQSAAFTKGVLTASDLSGGNEQSTA